MVKDEVPVAPAYSGLDGGMNKVFLARYPDRIIPLARVLPPTGSSEMASPGPPAMLRDSDVGGVSTASEALLSRRALRLPAGK